MIWYYMLHTIVLTLQGISLAIPEFAIVNQLPYGTDELVSSAFGTIYALGDWFLPLLTVIHVILLYLVYRMAKIVFEIFIIRKVIGR